MVFRKTVDNLILIAVICKCIVLANSGFSKQRSYSFSYVINTEDILSQHTEEAHNDVVTGSYSFLQPDGKIRVVRYKSDTDKGFRAYIKYRRLTNAIKGPLKFPRDFQHPIWFAEPVSTIPRSFLGPLNIHKKHHGG